jgi:Ankyrin repeats (3 copies)
VRETASRKQICWLSTCRKNTIWDFKSKKHQALNWALLLAASDGHALIVRSLLDAGADVHAGDEHALEAAVLNGHTETARVLLEAAADPHDESSPVAAWRLAAKNGHKETVKVLFDWTEQHPSGRENGLGTPQP